MAKKEPPKPMFPLKHQFYDSLDNYIHNARILADSVRTFVDLGEAANLKAFKEKLQERLDAFERASGN